MTIKMVNRSNEDALKSGRKPKANCYQLKAAEVAMNWGIATELESFKVEIAQVIHPSIFRPSHEGNSPLFPS